MKLVKRIGCRDYVVNVVAGNLPMGRIVNLDTATITISDRLPLHLLSEALNVCFEHEFPAIEAVPLISQHPSDECNQPCHSDTAPASRLRLAQ
jgi:hypothetical protein